MKKLLSIQSSPRGEASVSRTLSDKYVAQWKRRHPDGEVMVRDLMTTPLPFVDGPWIAGAFTPEPEKRSPEMTAALRISEELVAELKAADQLLIGTPMLNFSIPAVLKAYIDQVVRLNETFSRQTGGLLKNKTAKIILASGRDYTSGSPDAYLDHASGLLKGILSYMGITEVDIILAGGSLNVSRGLIKAEDHVAQYEAAVADLVG
jgi:FMN-dependent NADH-azoreductase